MGGPPVRSLDDDCDLRPARRVLCYRMNTTQQSLQVYGDRAKRLLQPVVLFITILWLIEIVDRLFFQGELDRLGIAPRQLAGLRGILFAPLLHASFAHLLANTIPLLILSALIVLRHNGRFWLITGLIVLVSGLGAWLIAPANTIHIGASGLIFGYFAYLVVNAFYERSLVAVGLAGLVILIYGGLLPGIWPGSTGISWQVHLFGLVGGILAAYYFSNRRV